MTALESPGHSVQRFISYHHAAFGTLLQRHPSIRHHCLVFLINDLDLLKDQPYVVGLERRTKLTGYRGAYFTVVSVCVTLVFTSVTSIL